MLRYRRYRAYLVFAVFVVFGLFYTFSGDSSWQPSTLKTPLNGFGFSGEHKTDPTLKSEHAYQPDLGGERKPDAPFAPLRTNDEDELPRKYGGGDKTHSGDKTGKSTEDKDMAKPITNHLNSEGASKDSASSKAGSIAKDDPESLKVEPDSYSEKRPDVVPHAEKLATTTALARAKVQPPVFPGTEQWSRQKEHFPVTSIIPLPTGTPKAIPKVQAKFPKESKADKTERLVKLKTIRAVAKKNWQNYKEFAWMHDELSPVSGGFKDPFGGWAATLVDALDTLYIMGLDDEFDEAVQAVKTIDFTRSVRDDIPLFETVIRYLGGMIGAYDVSGTKYPVLLDKAVELAEILMGAFDTPNRMPVTFYQWKPAFASQPHRAGANIVMAELGTLSLEFTRLAQLTRENKYYDAIDRITDAFVEWQTRPENGTLLPGLFPLNVDASGCLKPDPFSASISPPQMPQAPIQDYVKPASAKADSRVDMGETGLTHKPKDFDQRKKSSSPKAGLDDSDDSAPGSLSVGEVGRSKTAPALKDSPKKKASTTSPEDDEEKASDKVTGSTLQKVKTGKAKSFDDDESSKVDTGTTSAGKKAKNAKSVSDDDDDDDASLSSGVSSKGSQKKKIDKSLRQKRQLDLDATERTIDNLDSVAEKASKASKLQGNAQKAEKAPITGAGTAGKDASADSSDTLSSGPVKVIPTKTSTSTISYLPDEMEICAPSNLTTGNKHGRDRYSLSGMADSTYEYFQKTYILLGGVEDKYRGLHERSMDAATKYLIFRPMVPGDHDILISGDYDAWPSDDPFRTGSGVQGELVPDTAHLACFTGGMYALGAKLFDRPKDLEIAAKLTEGCVWAYNVTKTGVMPEAFALMPCASKTDCKWDPVKYGNVLDPQADFRQQMYEQQMREYEERLRVEKLSEERSAPKGGSAVKVEIGKSSVNDKPSAKTSQDISDDLESTPAQRSSEKLSKDNSSPNLKRRQLDDTKSSSSSGKSSSKKSSSSHDKADDEDSAKPAHSLGEHGYDDIKAGKPLDYTGSPSSSYKVGTEHTAGQPIDYDNTPRIPTLPSGLEWTPQPPQKPSPPPSHEETVRRQISDQGLTGGMTRIVQRKYILRPEAIESVWYMYRITGDAHWRQVGWDMFTAVDKATKTDYGNSAIDDVNQVPTQKTDSQESFWMAETLKYYYLLFAEEDVISLDDYVLNTEAHPFKRPTPNKKM